MPTIVSTLDVDMRSSMVHSFVKEESELCREAQMNEQKIIWGKQGRDDLSSSEGTSPVELEAD